MIQRNLCSSELQVKYKHLPEPTAKSTLLIHFIVPLIFFTFLVLLISCTSTDSGDSEENGEVLSVLSTVPADGNIGAKVDIITITFNNELDTSSVSNSSITVTGPFGQVAGSVAASDKILTFTPTRPLVYGQRYAVKVNTGVEDVNDSVQTSVRGDFVKNIQGNSLASAYTLNFRTRVPIMAGDWHMLAVSNNDNVWAWGNLGSGALGDGTYNAYSNAVQALGPDGTGLLEDIVAVAGGGGSGDEHSLALKGDGTIWAFGSNSSGQLGTGNTTSSNIPVQVTDPSDPSGYLTAIVAIAAAYDFSLAVKNDGTVWAWGINDSGMLGDGTTDNQPSSIPIPVCAVGATAPCSDAIDNILTDVVSVSASFSHVAALRNNGTVVTWGYNGYGALGNGSTSPSISPVEVCAYGATTPCSDASDNILTDVVEVVSGGEVTHSLALLKNGTVFGWGYGGYGYFGSYSTVGSQKPIPACDVGATSACTPGNGDLTGVIAIATGRYHSLALLNDNTLLAFGYNNYGALGDGSMTSTVVPIVVSGISDALAITASGNGSHTLLASGEVWGWGWNDNNELDASPDVGSPCGSRDCNLNPVRAGSVDLIP
jgi:alpha-tubulin suppressor-like RCC1 family protein